MRLNPEKSFFGVTTGKFLGFMITQRGIEANPDKCEAILSMRSLSSLKEVQRLNWKLTTFSRFLSKLVEKAKLLYKLLKGPHNFKWSNRCQEMFHNLERDIVALPILASPPHHSTLYLYLVVSSSALSSILIYEEGKKQHPRYFTNRTLQSVEERYQVIEKLVCSALYS